MPSARQRRGTAAEDQAAAFLQQKSYRIIDRHVTSRYGEIDILAADGETIVAVEVKARQSAAFGRAIEAVTPAKLAKITQALDDILHSRNWSGRPIRIDVVTIEPGSIQHYRAVS
ncbi:MAG: YraN family protein [Candidatus Kerfeldbacteria bacterium]|nr:YraN family protein [Candidatus Kerfeldbacteria bacterium]